MIIDEGWLDKYFWSKVIVEGPDDCWLWIAGTSGPYGSFRCPIRGRAVTAHHFSLELKLGRELQEGLFACHTCDIGLCVNPSHLWEDTQSANTLDMYAKGRNRGRSYPGHKKKEGTGEKQRIAQFTSRMRSCDDCGLETNAGSMAVHQQFTGHRGIGRL